MEDKEFLKGFFDLYREGKLEEKGREWKPNR
jgi:hypothetical protein